MCFCTVGSRTKTVSIEMGPAGALPLTLENLKKVTAIGYNTELNTVGLLVEYLPGENDERSYWVIDLECAGDLPDVGVGGIKLLKLIMYSITGELFEFCGMHSSQTMHCYRRHEFQRELDEYLAKKLDEQ